MRKLSLFVLTLAIAACGGSGGNSIVIAPKKPDPYITVRFRNLIDTTTAAGRADWHIFMDITSADPNQVDFVAVGAIGLNDLRLKHVVHCQGVGADSVGQRFVAFLALADTTTAELTAQAPADSVARAWVVGSRTLPAGWIAFYQPPTDAWTSAQFTAGHGLTPLDPIKWGFDWTAVGTASFYERTDADAACNIFGAG